MTDTVRRGHAMPFGAELTETGVRFRPWAARPARSALDLYKIDAPLAMRPLTEGWHELDASAGARCRFALEDGMSVPDPASRHQPEDVHGPSEVVDPPAFAWADAGWTGRLWQEAVVHESHVDALTPEGMFREAIDKLSQLKELGDPAGARLGSRSGVWSIEDGAGAAP